MDDNKRMTFALISGVIVISVSIFIAYISFNILDSSAEASLQNWKFGGAFASFVFTSSLLTSIIFQFYKQMTTDRIETYRQQIQELQTKLIKGASCPPGYKIDLDEMHKLVFARPGEWLPLNGILYQYYSKTPTDGFSTNFNIVYNSKEDIAFYYKYKNIGTFEPASVEVEKLYENYVTDGIETVRQNFGVENSTFSQEYIFVDGIKSLKYIHLYTFQPEEKKIQMCQSGIVTYIPRLQAVFIFTFSDLEKNYTESSEIFNTVISSIRFL